MPLILSILLLQNLRFRTRQSRRDTGGEGGGGRQGWGGARGGREWWGREWGGWVGWRGGGGRIGI